MLDVAAAAGGSGGRVAPTPHRGDGAGGAGDRREDGETGAPGLLLEERRALHPLDVQGGPQDDACTVTYSSGVAGTRLHTVTVEHVPARFSE